MARADRTNGRDDGRRRAAVEILEAVDGRQAFTGLALSAALGRKGLSAHARAYVTDAVYGVLRWRLTLDWMIGQCSRRPVDRMDPVIRNILRLAAYEIRFMDGVPGPVAVHQAVELAKDLGGPGTAGFVNGVCRAIARREEAGDWPWPDSQQAPVRALAVETSHPEWLVARWVERFGLKDARRHLESNNEVPEVHLRTNTLKTSRELLAARLREAGVYVVEGELAPEALRVRGMGRVDAQAAFQDGWFAVQDEAAQLVARALEPQPGQRIIDLCAAPGGKTTHLAQLMENRGEVVAVDVHPGKLRLVEEAAKRLGVAIVRPLAADGRELPGRLRPAARVLLDAPCSGLGVLRRRPDLRWRRRPEDIPALAALQRELLSAAAALTGPGGTVVYSTCSTEPEETTGVIARFLDDNPAFTAEDPPVPGVPAGDGPGVYLFPHLHETDGFYIARLKRIN
ncbi:MAG: 16S rRNA (cytosine(967)-C(5))-methyltransferase RsmB [Firmicutes bacterium]|nr:16S rRNA (cytosine(967)-C(5))-methyltransferase RsmB [Bacillota bacterium]